VDWFDPNTWKLPAELIGYAQQIIVRIVAIVGAIATILLKPLWWFRSRTKSKVQPKSISLIFVPNDQRCHWGGASLNGHFCKWPLGCDDLVRGQRGEAALWLTTMRRGSNPAFGLNASQPPN
jgi:hypothetical protein